MTALSRSMLPPLPRPSAVALVAIGTATGWLADAYGVVTHLAAGVGSAVSAALPGRARPVIGTNPQRRYGSAASRRLAR